MVAGLRSPPPAQPSLTGNRLRASLALVCVGDAAGPLCPRQRASASETFGSGGGPVHREDGGKWFSRRELQDAMAGWDATDISEGWDSQRVFRELRQLLHDKTLLVGNPSPAYAAALRSTLVLPDQEAPPPRLLAICSTLSLLREHLPEASSDVLLFTLGHLQDGCVVPLVLDLLTRPDPPLLLVVLGIDDPALPLAPLLTLEPVQLVWEGNIGSGVLLQAVEHLMRGERFVDPEARRRIEAVVALAGALTAREQQVLSLVAEGLTNRQIAERLVVAEVTARDHVMRILRKLEVPDRTAAAVLAMRLGLLG